jgi:hypothetical protein
MLTTAIVRSEHRELLRGALTGMLAVALSIVAASVLGVNLLHLSAAYLPKALLLFTAGAGLVLLALPGSHRFVRMGAANQVTIVRGALVALLAALLGEHISRAIATVVVVVASAAMLLDGVDGWLARRSGTASAFGARLDMETDALFVAVLALLVWQFGKAGSWVLLSGLMRYLFGAVVAFIPRLQRPVAFDQSGKDHCRAADDCAHRGTRSRLRSPCLCLGRGGRAARARAVLRARCGLASAATRGRCPLSPSSAAGAYGRGSARSSR